MGAPVPGWRAPEAYVAATSPTTPTWATTPPSSSPTPAWWRASPCPGGLRRWVAEWPERVEAPGRRRPCRHRRRPHRAPPRPGARHRERLRGGAAPGRPGGSTGAGCSAATPPRGQPLRGPGNEPRVARRLRPRPALHRGLGHDGAPDAGLEAELAGYDRRRCRAARRALRRGRHEPPHRPPEPGPAPAQRRARRRPRRRARGDPGAPVHHGRPRRPGPSVRRVRALAVGGGGPLRGAGRAPGGLGGHHGRGLEGRPEPRPAPELLQEAPRTAGSRWSAPAPCVPRSTTRARAGSGP